MNYKCYNAFKEGGRYYKYDEIITQEEYQNLSGRNQKWFHPVPK